LPRGAKYLNPDLDVVITGKDDKEVTERLLKVLERLKLAGLIVKASKYKFL
jgi:hypothetical protein